MKKNLLFIVLAAFMISLLAGCSKDGASGGGGGEIAKEEGAVTPSNK